MSPRDLSELRQLAQRDQEHRLARCIGKDRYQTRGMAHKAISRRLAGAGCVPYRCNFCDQWHVGTTIAKRHTGRDSEKKSAGHARHA